MAKIPTYGLRPDDLVSAAAEHGVDLGLPEARRVMAEFISHGRPDLSRMRNPVGKRLRAHLESITDRSLPAIEERIVDPHDQSVRYLFRLADGERVEAVRIPLHTESRFSVCLSSQVGCAMQCAFCATGRLGLRRHLTAHEMVGCFLAVRRDAPGRVSGAVFMGQGEPLHNYDAVIRAAQVLAHPCGGRISAKSISISTVGIVPRIHQFAAEGHKFRLVVSLTSADPDTRASLLPIAGRWSLDELADSIRALYASQRRRVTIAWVLMSGVNTDPSQALALKHLLPDVPIRVNLIDVNDGREGGFKRASDEERNHFVDALQILESPVVRRYSVGREQHSACGMLAAAARQDAVQ